MICNAVSSVRFCYVLSIEWSEWQLYSHEHKYVHIGMYISMYLVLNNYRIYIGNCELISMSAVMNEHQVFPSTNKNYKRNKVGIRIPITYVLVAVIPMY